VKKIICYKKEGNMILTNVEFLPGTSINRAAREVQEACLRLQVDIQFKFNGVQICANRFDNLQSIAKKYDDGRKEQRGYS
jgi:hypothetical protein